MAAQSFNLEKLVWTEADFEQMGWHDVHIYAVAFRQANHELWLDLDYMFKWAYPEGEDTKYHFWIAPVTLVYWNVHTLKLDIESHDGDLEIQDIKRSEPCRARNSEYIAKQTEWLWLLECQQGEITFRSVGFSQFTRRSPVFQQKQKLTLECRGGISFARDYAP